MPELDFEGLVEKVRAQQRSLATDPAIVTEALRYADKLVPTYRQSLDAYQTFLPPRLVRGLGDGNCLPFFGAGVSADAGAPTWADLLASLGVRAEPADDPVIDEDPLTAAEVVAHEIGRSRIQQRLREIYGPRQLVKPTLGYLLLAALQQPTYITTNYDCLFERSWELLYGVSPIVITSDNDVVRTRSASETLRATGECTLIKIHGCAGRDAEDLILTRRDYRRHYRANSELFTLIRSEILRGQTLFLGFSHRDPEISRLVDDVIYQYEVGLGPEDKAPAIYSLQFDMRVRTPEVFAARGIVALEPPVTLDSPAAQGLSRSSSFAKALIDVNAAARADVHSRLDLDQPLQACVARLEAALTDARSVLAEVIAIAPAELDPVEEVQRGQRLLQRLGGLAGQGIYLLNKGGRIEQAWLPSGLSRDRRVTSLASFHDRPFFRQANSFRDFFVSDSFASQFNGNSTIALCLPRLNKDGNFDGCAFAAFQIGAWTLPLDLRDELREADPGVGVYLVDGNGVALFPPEAEFEAAGASVTEGDPAAAIEDVDCNIGFGYERLVRLSRVNRVIDRLWSNIVPLAQDDDVFRLTDVRLYSVVTELANSRVKFALSKPYPTGGSFAKR